MRESKVEAYLRKRVREAGGLCWKFNSPGLIGVPDRVVIWSAPLDIHFVETKAENGRLHSAQERRHAELRERGRKVFILWSIEWIDWYMVEIVGVQLLTSTPMGRLQNA